MVEEGYAEELLKEKVASMKQLDRIEYKNEVYAQKSFLNILILYVSVLLSTSFIIIFFGVVWSLLGYYNLYMGLDITHYKIGAVTSWFFSLLFVILALKSIHLHTNKKNQFAKENEEFIKEHTK